MGIALINNLLAGSAFFGGLDLDDLLAAAGPADSAGIDAEIGAGLLLDPIMMKSSSPFEVGMEQTEGKTLK